MICLPLRFAMISPNRLCNLFPPSYITAVGNSQGGNGPFLITCPIHQALVRSPIDDLLA